MGRHLYAMLNYHQLSPLVTRRWLKPTSHTADLRSSVGAPWEIKRLDGLSEHHTIDWYAKGGSIPYYYTQYIIIPDLEIGISIQSTTKDKSVITTIEDYIQQAIDPSLYEIARRQALQKYGGLYTLDGLNATHDQKNGSSILVTADAGPGLVLSNVTVNGQVITNKLADSYPDSQLPRLYPMAMANANSSSAQFRVVGQSGNVACISWLTVDDTNYGNQPLDNFIFEMGPNGIVQSVVNPGLRLRLRKVL
jgi:hypothetical protein